MLPAARTDYNGILMVFPGENRKAGTHRRQEVEGDIRTSPPRVWLGSSCAWGEKFFLRARLCLLAVNTLSDDRRLIDIIWSCDSWFCWFTSDACCWEGKKPLRMANFLLCRSNNTKSEIPDNLLNKSDVYLSASATAGCGVLFLVSIGKTVIFCSTYFGFHQRRWIHQIKRKYLLLRFDSILRVLDDITCRVINSVIFITFSSNTSFLVITLSLW